MLNKLVARLKASVTNAELEAIALTDLSGQFDIVINATSASLGGDALILPDSSSV